MPLLLRSMISLVLDILRTKFQRLPQYFQGWSVQWGICRASSMHQSTGNRYLEVENRKILKVAVKLISARLFSHSMYIFAQTQLRHRRHNNFTVVCQRIKYGSWKTGSNYTIWTAGGIHEIPTPIPMFSGPPTTTDLLLKLSDTDG